MARVTWCWMFAMLSLGGAGCDSSSPAARAPAALIATAVDGEPLLVSPTAPIRLRFSSPPMMESLGADAIAVVRGAVDASALRVLERAATHGEPTTARDRLAPVRLSAVDGDPTVVELRPARPLAAGTLHTLVVTTRVKLAVGRLGRGELRQFSTAAVGAPVLALVAPEDGAMAVVRNLRRVLVSFSRLVHDADEESLRLVDEAGDAVPARVEAGPAPGQYWIEPDAPLAAAHTYRATAAPTIRDEVGEPPFVPEVAPGFSTGSGLRTQAPRVAALDLAASSGCLVARFTTDVAAAAALCVDDDCAADEQLLADHELMHRLSPGANATVRLRARDESTAPEAALGPIAAPATSARSIVITEVLSRPRAGRLAQQWVELQNQGAVPVSVEGLELHDERGGNTLPAATLPPGGYALVVPNSYVTPDGAADGDVAPRAGTPLLRVAENHLGGNGIRETGEAISLVESDGRPASRFSTEGLKLAAGQSAGRRGACDVSASWAPTIGDAATPGGP